MDIFNSLKMTASQCGLPASTVKLSRPPRNACESAADNLTSISRYRAPECMCVSACVYVCVMRVCTCEDALVALSVSVSRLCKHVCVYSVGACMCMWLFLSGSMVFQFVLISDSQLVSDSACPDPKTHASCGPGTACPAAISSLDDTMLSVVITGLKV